MDYMTAATIVSKLNDEWAANWGATTQNEWTQAIEHLDRAAALKAAERYTRRPGDKPKLAEFLAVAHAQAERLADAAKPLDPDQRFKLSDDTIATGRRHIDTIMDSLAKRGVTTARRTQ